MRPEEEELPRLQVHNCVEKHYRPPPSHHGFRKTPVRHTGLGQSVVKVVLVCGAMDAEGFAMEHFDMASIAGAYSRLRGAKVAERHEISQQRMWISAIVDRGRDEREL